MAKCASAAHECREKFLGSLPPSGLRLTEERKALALEKDIDEFDLLVLGQFPDAQRNILPVPNIPGLCAFGLPLAPGSRHPG